MYSLHAIGGHGWRYTDGILTLYWCWTGAVLAFIEIAV